jgi:hypothetical protein
MISLANLDDDTFTSHVPFGPIRERFVMEFANEP